MTLNGFQIVHISESAILKDRRTKLSLTQQQVADKAHIQLRQYQKFESGERDLSSSSFRIACNVIQALDMDITAYLKGDYCFSDET